MEIDQRNFSYISRLEKLEKLYLTGESLLKKNEEMWDQLVEEECNPIKLTMLADKIEETRIKMNQLKKAIQEIKLILAN